MNRPRGDSVTVGQALSEAAACLREAGIEGARRDARALIGHVLGGGPELILGHPERPLQAREQDAIRALIARRATREPVSRILGKREFWGLEFSLSPATLDPRPDSETLVEAVLGRIEDRSAPVSILDLGTGSGCLLLALLSELPGADGFGLDISPEAVETARGNARALGLAERAAFRVADWQAGLEPGWQVIVSNPPYIKDTAIADLAPEVARYDPPPALAGGADGLGAYRVLLPQIACSLAAEGFAALEVGVDQAESVAELASRSGLEVLDQVRDLAGIERCLLVAAAGAVIEA